MGRILSWIATAMVGIGGGLLWIAGNIEGEEKGRQSERQRYRKSKLTLFNKSKNGPGMCVMLHEDGTQFPVANPEVGLTYGDIEDFNREHPDKFIDGFEFDWCRVEECNEDECDD